MCVRAGRGREPALRSPWLSAARSEQRLRRRLADAERPTAVSRFHGAGRDYAFRDAGTVLRAFRRDMVCALPARVSCERALLPCGLWFLAAVPRDGMGGGG